MSARTLEENCIVFHKWKASTPHWQRKVTVNKQPEVGPLKLSRVVRSGPQVLLLSSEGLRGSQPRVGVDSVNISFSLEFYSSVLSRTEEPRGWSSPVVLKMCSEKSDLEERELGQPPGGASDGGCGFETEPALGAGGEGLARAPPRPNPFPAWSSELRAGAEDEGCPARVPSRTGQSLSGAGSPRSSHKPLSI